MEEITIIEKICNAIKEIGIIPKSGKNNFQNYEYRKHEDIMTAIKPILCKHGLVLYPIYKIIHTSEIIEKKDKHNCHVILSCTYGITDGKSEIKFSGIGEGIDTGDKAVYKAQTGAIKYALNDLLLIASEADPENEIVGKNEMNDISENAKSKIADLGNKMSWSIAKIDLALQRAKVVGEDAAIKSMEEAYNKQTDNKSSGSLL